MAIDPNQFKEYTDRGYRVEQTESGYSLYSPEEKYKSGRNEYSNYSKERLIFDSNGKLINKSEFSLNDAKNPSPVVTHSLDYEEGGIRERFYTVQGYNAKKRYEQFTPIGGQPQEVYSRSVSRNGDKKIDYSNMTTSNPYYNPETKKIQNVPYNRGQPSGDYIVRTGTDTYTVRNADGTYSRPKGYVETRGVITRTSPSLSNLRGTIIDSASASRATSGESALPAIKERLQKQEKYNERYNNLITNLNRQKEEQALKAYSPLISGINQQAEQQKNKNIVQTQQVNNTPQGRIDVLTKEQGYGLKAAKQTQPILDFFSTAGLFITGQTQEGVNLLQPSQKKPTAGQALGVAAGVFAVAGDLPIGKGAQTLRTTKLLQKAEFKLAPEGFQLFKQGESVIVREGIEKTAKGGSFFEKLIYGTEKYNVNVNKLPVQPRLFSRANLIQTYEKIGAYDTAIIQKLPSGTITGIPKSAYIAVTRPQIVAKAEIVRLGVDEALVRRDLSNEDLKNAREKGYDQYYKQLKQYEGEEFGRFTGQGAEETGTERLNRYAENTLKFGKITAYQLLPGISQSERATAYQRLKQDLEAQGIKAGTKEYNDIINYVTAKRNAQSISYPSSLANLNFLTERAGQRIVSTSFASQQFKPFNIKESNKILGKATSPVIGGLGAVEGFTSIFLQSRSEGKDIKESVDKNALIGAGLGYGTGRAFNYFITTRSISSQASKNVLNRASPKIATGLSYITDPFEAIGDIGEKAYTPVESFIRGKPYTSGAVFKTTRESALIDIKEQQAKLIAQAEGRIGKGKGKITQEQFNLERFKIKNNMIAKEAQIGKYELGNVERIGIKEVADIRAGISRPRIRTTTSPMDIVLGRGTSVTTSQNIGAKTQADSFSDILGVGSQTNIQINPNPEVPVNPEAQTGIGTNSKTEQNTFIQQETQTNDFINTFTNVNVPTPFPRNLPPIFGFGIGDNSEGAGSAKGGSKIFVNELQAGAAFLKGGLNPVFNLKSPRKVAEPRGMTKTQKKAVKAESKAFFKRPLPVNFNFVNNARLRI